MLTNTAATIYNAYTDPDTGKTDYRRTVIPAVHWEDIAGSSVSGTSHPSANSASIFIPFYAQDSMERKYVPAVDYADMTDEEKEKHWTIRNGDLIIKGEILDEITTESGGIKKFSYLHNDAVTVQTLLTADYGSYAMRHWEVTAT